MSGPAVSGGHTPGKSALAMAAAMIAASAIPYAVSRDQWDDLADLRRAIPSKRVLRKRASMRRATCNTHRRNRAKVAAGRKANVARIRAAIARTKTGEGE